MLARSTTSDRRGAVEFETVIATKRGLTAVVVIVRFDHATVRGCVGVRARALRGGAGTAGRGAVPGDGASVSGVARACSASGVVGIRNVTRRRCGNADVHILIFSYVPFSTHA